MTVKASNVVSSIASETVDDTMSLSMVDDANSEVNVDSVEESDGIVERTVLTLSLTVVIADDVASVSGKAVVVVVVVMVDGVFREGTTRGVNTCDERAEAGLE